MGSAPFRGRVFPAPGPVASGGMAFAPQPRPPVSFGGPGAGAGSGRCPHKRPTKLASPPSSRSPPPPRRSSFKPGGPRCQCSPAAAAEGWPRSRPQVKGRRPRRAGSPAPPCVPPAGPAPRFAPLPLQGAPSPPKRCGRAACAPCFPPHSHSGCPEGPGRGSPPSRSGAGPAGLGGRRWLLGKVGDPLAGPPAWPCWPRGPCGGGRRDPWCVYWGGDAKLEKPKQCVLAGVPADNGPPPLGPGGGRVHEGCGGAAGPRRPPNPRPRCPPGA